MPRMPMAPATSLLTRPFCARLWTERRMKRRCVEERYSSPAAQISSKDLPSRMREASFSMSSSISGPVLSESKTWIFTSGWACRYSSRAAIADDHVPDKLPVMHTTKISSAPSKALIQFSGPGQAVPEGPLCEARKSSIAAVSSCSLSTKSRPPARMVMGTD